MNHPDQQQPMRLGSLKWDPNAEDLIRQMEAIGSVLARVCDVSDPAVIELRDHYRERLGASSFEIYQRGATQEESKGRVTLIFGRKEKISNFVRSRIMQTRSPYHDDKSVRQHVEAFLADHSDMEFIGVDDAQRLVIEMLYGYGDDVMLEPHELRSSEFKGLSLCFVRKEALAAAALDPEGITLIDSEEAPKTIAEVCRTGYRYVGYTTNGEVERFRQLRAEYGEHFYSHQIPGRKGIAGEKVGIVTLCFVKNEDAMAA